MMTSSGDNLRRLVKHVRHDSGAPAVPPKPGCSPEDPDKPSLPYVLGFTTQIEPHEAPPPFGDDKLYGPRPRGEVSDVDLKTLTQSALVVSHPPIETSPAASPDGSAPEVNRREAAQLTITSAMRIGYDGGAQVVACKVAQSGRQPFHAVAKIFDALYYRFPKSRAPTAPPPDVAARADIDYAAEAAAYGHLARVGEAGASAPKYYGSWTLKLPISSRGVFQLRPVRLILVERLDGMNLNGLRMQNSLALRNGPDAFHLPADYRLEVLARALDGYVRMLHCGIDHGKLAGRNVVLVTENNRRWSAAINPGIPRVALVDYKGATVYGRTNMGKHPHEDLARPISPLEWFWTLPLAADFEGWVPREWQSSQKLQQEWLMRRFGGEGQRALYEPVGEELKFSSY